MDLSKEGSINLSRLSTPQSSADQNTPKLLTRTDLKRLGISLSNTQLLRLERADRFPRRIYLTPARVVWYAHEILEWLDARAAERVHRVYGDY